MSRIRTMRTLTAVVGLSALLAVAGCSSDGSATDPTSAPTDGASSTQSPDPTSSARPGADGSTLRFVFTVLGKIGAPPVGPEGSAPAIPESDVNAAAEQLRERFTALGRPDAVTVEDGKIVVEAAGVADDLMYLASLASLNIQLRPVQAMLDGEGDKGVEPEPGSLKVVSSSTLTQGWIDDVASRNCIDPTKMSLATLPAPIDDYVAYCVPVDFVRSGGDTRKQPAIEDTQKVIFGPAFASNTDIERVTPGSNGTSMNLTFTAAAKSTLQSETERLAALPDCTTYEETPTSQQVQAGCNEMAVLLDGLVLVFDSVEQANSSGEVSVPLNFVAWEPRLIAEASPLFTLTPMEYAFQRVE